MYNALWQSVLGEIELSVPHGQFEAWFKNTTLLDYTDDAVTIGVANIFAKSQFEKRYDDKIREVLKHNGVAAPTVQYQVHTVKKSIVNRETTGDTDAMSARIESLVAPMPSVSVPASSA